MDHELFIPGPYFEPGMILPNGRLARFCKGNSSTQSNPNNSQTVNDSRIGASENAIVATGGSKVIKQNVSDKVVTAAGDAIAHLAEQGGKNMADVSKTAIKGNVAVAGKAMDTTAGTARDALDFGESTLAQSLALVKSNQDNTNSLLRDTQQQFTSNLAKNAGESIQNVASDIAKYAMIGTGLVVAAVVFRSSAKK